MTPLHFIIRKPCWYDDSKELTLAFNSLLETIHYFNEADVILLESRLSPEKDDPLELDRHISNALTEIERQHNSDSDFIFFIKDPALIVDKHVIPRMVSVLQNNTINCVVPSSYPCEFPTSNNLHYFTLKGYQHYVSEVLEPVHHSIKDFDGRSTHIFAVELQFLLENNIHSQFFQIPAQFSPETAIALGAYIHPFVDYFNGANLDILEYIPASAKTLLDIGCSSGEFGSAVINKLQLHVEGIEINDTAANIAKNKLHKVYHGDALKLATDTTFDCVTCLDVLEHFADVDKLLQQIARCYLKDSGTLLLNLPNIGHWSIVDDLLSGRWDYLPGGTLCNTHLQFFTCRTIIDMLQRNQYLVTDIIPVQAALPDTIEKQFKMLEAAGKKIDWESLTTISFKVIAHKDTKQNLSTSSGISSDISSNREEHCA